MKENPSYEELIKANEVLREKVRWLEGIYNDQKDAGMQVKSRFLSNISHEIRTPMNAILGFSDLLKNDDLSDREKDEYIDYIFFNSQSLLKVMENVIDLTLLETRNLRLKRDEVFLDDMMRLIYQRTRIHVIREMQYSVALLLTLPKEYQRVRVELDGLRLQRLLDSLVNNLITIQQKGVIELKLDIENEKFVNLYIISKKNELLEERAKMIFEKTEGTDEWYNHLDNYGVAYKLSKELVEAMGGKVGVKTIDNKRMAICFELPLKKAGRKTKVVKASSAGSVTRLLN